MALSHAVEGYAGVDAGGTVTVTVKDLGAAGLTFGQRQLSVSEGGGSAAYTVVLKTVPAAR